MSSARKGGGAGGEGWRCPGYGTACLQTGAATGVVFCFCLRTCYCSVLQKLRFCVVGKMRLPGGIVSMGSRVKIRPFGGARRLISMEAIENPLQTGPYTVVCCLTKEWGRRIDPLEKTEDWNKEKMYQRGEEGCFFSYCNLDWAGGMGND
jgi:hypothetical protein